MDTVSPAGKGEAFKPKPVLEKAEMETDTLRRKKQITGLAEEKRPVLEEEPRTSFSSLHDTFIKVKKLIMLAEGRTLSIEYEPNTERPKSIRAEIPAKNYKSFCDRLNRLAILHTIPPNISENGQGTIQVRIRFIMDI